MMSLMVVCYSCLFITELDKSEQSWSFMWPSYFFCVFFWCWLFLLFSLMIRRWLWPGGWHGPPWSLPWASGRQKAHWLSPPWDQQSKQKDESAFKILVESLQMTRFTLVVAPMSPSRTKTESPSLRKMNPKIFSSPLPNLDIRVMVRISPPVWLRLCDGPLRQPALIGLSLPPVERKWKWLKVMMMMMMIIGKV